MNPSSEHAYVGLGPMLLEEEYMVANQKNVVNDVVKKIASTCYALEKLENLPRDNQNFAPHHVISIIGGRGTGKTSVVTTIAEQVKKDVKKAFVIDLINPDQLSAKFPVSAIIVYAIERALEKQEKWEIIKNKITDEKERTFRPVSWAVQISETFDVISRDSINTREWHNKLFELMVSPVDLVPGFHTWLGKILDAIDCKVCVISIDDADISVEKAEEIIETIRIYLASPLIVTLLAIDLPSLERKLRNARLAKLPPVPEYKGKENEDMFSFLGMSRGAYQSAEAKAEQEYVENLLVKVLPPATRHYLTGLSEKDRLYKPFQIPGRGKKKSLFEILKEADKKNIGVELAPLFQKYPEIFTDNVRRYSNLFVQISNFSDQYITEITEIASLSQEDKDKKLAEYLSLTIPILGGDSKTVEKEVSQESYLNSIKTYEELITSEFQMQIMRPFLSEGEFQTLQSYIRQNYKIDITQFQTIHEFANFILRQAGVNYRSQWEIADKTIENSMSTALINLVGDWMLANGVKMEYIIDNFDIKIEAVAFPRIQVSKKLARYFSEEKLSLIEPNIRTTKAFDGSVGANVVVPVNKDCLMPGYVQDFSSLRRYMKLVLNYSTLASLIKSAEGYITVFKEAKRDELKKDDLQLAVYQIFGLLATQTMSHLLHLIVELLFDGDTEKFLSSPQNRNRFNSITDKNLSWLIVETSDILGGLSEIIERKEQSYSQKLLALSYVADLPMKILLGCISGKDGKDPKQQQDRLLKSIHQLFNELTDIGLIINRTQEQPIGELNPNPPDEAAKIRKALSKDYPSFNWERRWEAMDIFISDTLKNATFEESWKSADEPPKLWVKWADDILADFSPEDLEEAEADADKDKSERK